MLTATASPDQTNSEDLICEHLYLVPAQAAKVMRRVPAHVRYDDLFSAGQLALVKAAASFDPSRGVDFPAFALRRIQGAMLDELRSVDWASRGVRRMAREIDEVRARLRQSLGREVSDQEVAETMGIEVHKVAEVAGDVYRAVVTSLDCDAPEQASTPLTLLGSSDLPEEAALRREQMRYLVAAVAELPERLRAVIEGHYFTERPMSEMAREWGVTDSRVSQIRAEAVDMLRGALNYVYGQGTDLAMYARQGGMPARRRLAYYEAVQARFTGTPVESTPPLRRTA